IASFTGSGLRRRLGGPAARVIGLRLERNGTIAPLIEPRKVGGTVRPAWINGKGRLRRINVRITHAWTVRATYGRHRVLLHISRRPDGPRGEDCSALWLGTPSGRRWRRLKFPDPATAQVVSWTSKHLVLRRGNSKGRDFLDVIDRPERLRLSTRQRPTC
ncbi:MAG: hypothetical protein AB7G37_13635, partial [Solirubrobacteraceae bacterium]